MTLLIVAPNRDTHGLENHLRQMDPDLDIRIWPTLGPVEDIEFAVLWKHPQGLLAELPMLKAISSYGAGVEAILSDPDLPADLPVGRICGPRLAADMAEFLAGVVINRHRGLFGFYEDQKHGQWRPWAPEQTPVIGILGLGNMGMNAARLFLALGYVVHGWSRSGKQADNIIIHQGDDGLNNIAAAVDYLICLLPLTARTKGILNAGLFERMKSDAYLINVGRGGHLIEADLIPAIDAGCLSGAYLDVFAQEPLPADHPFWRHPRILISPHCASFTLPREAAELILRSYRRVQQGEPPLDTIDRERGY